MKFSEIFGELIVVGKGEIFIPLKHKPLEVLVKFSKELECVPCNPHTIDVLEWEIIKSHKNKDYNLIIKWSVSDVREIKWEVFY